MIVPEILPRESPLRLRRWSSQTTYSSAVRLKSVELRHAPSSVSPFHTAKTVLVLLALMASSIGPHSARILIDRRRRIYHGRHREHGGRKNNRASRIRNYCSVSSVSPW